MLLLAIDIGGTKYSVALVNERGQIVKKQTGATKRSGGAEWMIERVLGSAGAIIGNNVVSSCGIGFGGPVDFVAQKVLSSTHVPGWECVPESRSGGAQRIRCANTLAAGAAYDKWPTAVR